MRDRESFRAARVLAIVIATTRGTVMLDMLISGRERIKALKTRSKAADRIARFYRTRFILINFRRHKRCRAALARQFSRWLPNWRLKRNLNIARKIVAFCLTFSGTGGPVAAIKSFRAKVVFLQRCMRRYMGWKRKILYPWQTQYTETHQTLCVEWDKLRKEAYQKASKEGLTLDADGNPVGLPKKLEAEIDKGTSMEQLWRVFKKRKKNFQVDFAEYHKEMLAFKKAAQLKLRMRLAQKMIQGANFDIEKVLDEESAKGEIPLCPPDCPTYDKIIDKQMMIQLVYFGSDVMAAKEELEISRDTEYLLLGIFKSAKISKEEPDE